MTPHGAVSMTTGGTSMKKATAKARAEARVAKAKGRTLPKRK